MVTLGDNIIQSNKLKTPKKMKDILADALLLQITTLNSFNRLQRYANVTLIVQKKRLF